MPSQRMPRLSVSRLVTRQSSMCVKIVVVVGMCTKFTLAGSLYEEAKPIRKSANPLPVAEELKLNCPPAFSLELLASYECTYTTRRTSCCACRESIENRPSPA